MKRQLETVTQGLHNVHYTAWDWAAFNEVRITGMRDVAQSGPWSPGRLLESSRDLQLDAIRAFTEYAGSLDTIRKDNDLTKQAKERRTSETLERLVAALSNAFEQAVADMEALEQNARAGMLPYAPLAAGDVVGAMQDQEIRAFLRDAGEAERRKLTDAMSRGEHPAMLAAALRGPDALLSGMTDIQRRQIEGAGIAAQFGESAEYLKLMVAAHDDARITAHRVLHGLAKVADLGTNTLLVRSIDQSLAKAEVVPRLMDWLKGIPSEPLDIDVDAPARTAPAAAHQRAVGDGYIMEG